MRVHHERSVADDRFVDRLAAQHHQRRVGLRFDGNVASDKSDGGAKITKKEAGMDVTGDDPTAPLSGLSAVVKKAGEGKGK